MNQILSTSMPIDNTKKKEPKVRKTNPVDIKSIAKVFAVLIFIFGICMVGTGGYAIYANQVEKEEQNLEPTILIEHKTENNILLKITHKKDIEKLEYGWNNEEMTTVNGKNGRYLEQEITIPSGTNTLYVVVTDETGKQITYEKQYEMESNINIEVTENKIKISYEGETNISYVAYSWDDGDEEIIDIDNKSFEKEIDVMSGSHTLTVTVVDVNNHKDTKKQKIKGVFKPKLEIDVDDTVEHFVIRASDEEKISKIEFILNQNGQVYLLDLEDMDLKELEYTLPMAFERGENYIEVTVYNENNITNNSIAKFRKE